MNSAEPGPKPYDRLLCGTRFRKSKVQGRTLEEEADADRGRVLFSAPFRRLQNKAQVFSLEANASVRSRLTHSLEVSSIGRFVAQQALKALGEGETERLGIAGKERALITFVESACLLHDIGNPPFGHFGEIAISDWFHQRAGLLRPKDLGGGALQLWEKFFTDFTHFDGNPQGFRICTRLQPFETGDLFGLNLTLTTLAAILKYPWTSNRLDVPLPESGEARKKAGIFWTEADVIKRIEAELGLAPECRHPLVYLMEAADDIAYCVSDIEDGFEKGIITCKQFAQHMLGRTDLIAALERRKDKDAVDIRQAIAMLQDPIRHDHGEAVERLTPMQDFRSGIIRFLSRHAGEAFASNQKSVIEGTAGPFLRNGDASLLLNAIKAFAVSALYSSPIVRNREITAQAVLSGLLDAYQPIMSWDVERFHSALEGDHKDKAGRSIARERALVNRIARKHLVVYHDSVKMESSKLQGDLGRTKATEHILRIRLIVDHITGMTDEFALQSFQHISGVQVNPYRN